MTLIEIEYKCKNFPYDEAEDVPFMDFMMEHFRIRVSYFEGHDIKIKTPILEGRYHTLYYYKDELIIINGKWVSMEAYLKVQEYGLGCSFISADFINKEDVFN